jgi:hypothetical protein
MPLARLSLIVLLTGLGTTAAWGQNQEGNAAAVVPDTVVQRVSEAFRAGDAQLLLAPAAERVEVSLFGTRTVYSSAQAFYVLREFFERHSSAAFTIVDTTGTGTSCFLRGRLPAARGERPLQVYVRLVRREGDMWKLYEVRIDSEAE